MAFELLTTEPALLRESHLLRFAGNWPAAKKDKWFMVDRSYQIKYDVSRIVSSGDSQDLRFEAASGSDSVGANNLALVPKAEDTVYELLVGIKGNVLVYPRYYDRYLLSLEGASGIGPDVTDAEQRYLGFYDEMDSPFEAPRLREYVVAAQETPVVRLYNDHSQAERVVLRFIVNRCRILVVDNPASLPDVERNRTRVAKYHDLTAWGG